MATHLRLFYMHHLLVQRENDYNAWKLMADEMIRLNGSDEHKELWDYDEHKVATCAHCGSASSWADDDEGGGCYCGGGEC